MTLNAIDCSVRLNSQLAKSLKSSGVSVIGRYLGFKTFGWSKSLTADEVKAISDAGLRIFSIYESSPTKASYFSYDAGVRDAHIAYSEAQYLNQPSGSAIYFTVDFDAQSKDMPEIQNYVKGIKDTLKDYKVGLYGSFNVCSSITGVDLYFQTYAWSGGKDFGNRAVYQYHNDMTIDGVSCDADYIYTEVGLWPMQYTPMEVKVNSKPYKAITVGSVVYVMWSALNEFGVKYSYKGNGVMTINGDDVQGVVFEGDTYLPWYCLNSPNKVKAIKDNNEWSFSPDSPSPTPKFYVEVGPFDTKDEAQKFADLFKSGVNIKEEN